MTAHNRTHAGPTRRGLLGTASALALTGRAQAQGAPPFKIGVLSDQSGIMLDYSGLGTVASVTMAVEDFGGTVLGRPIQVLRGDHQNKPDVGTGIARGWYDSGVAAIFDIGTTSVALPVQTLARDKDRMVIFTSSATSDLTGSACSPNGIHWVFNNYSQALGAVKVLSDRDARTWFFLTVDYAYGRAVQRDTTAMIEARGGKVLGAVVHAFDTTDYSSFLLAAQASGADAVALATTTAHAANIIKQAEEFGLRARGQRLAPLSLTLLDVKAIGLEAAQGMIETAPYYWDQNDATRAFAERYRKRTGKMPNMVQAGAYGAVAHYLRAVRDSGTDAALPVIAQMKATPINDFMTRNGSIRADGRVIRDMYVLEVKAPAESSGEWDLERVIATIPGTEAFQPATAACSLVKA